MRQAILTVIFVYALLAAPACGIALWHSLKQPITDRACYAAECRMTDAGTIQCDEPQRRDCP